MRTIPNTALRWLLPRVAPALIRWKVRRPESQSDIATSQSAALEKILRELQDTEQGKSLGLGGLTPLRGQNLTKAYRELVQRHQYADVEDWITRASRGEPDILFPGTPAALAQTSGTTSDEHAGERWIPQNHDLLEHHARGAMSALDRLLEASGPAALRGRLLMLGGSTSLERNAWDIRTGDLSGITVERIPWFLNSLYEPGTEIALESDWTLKVQRIALKLAQADVTLISGIPSWCAILFEEVCRLRGVARLREAWPNLRAFVHGGVSIDPYLPFLREHLAPDTWMQEVYPSSEAFLAIGRRAWRLDEGGPPELELLVNHGVYLEFLPQDETDSVNAVGADALEPGTIYRVLVTTPGGLLRYEIGDLVEGRGPGLVRFAGRVRARISVFGEHVEAMRLAQALSHACLATESVITEWHVAPVLPTATDPRGAHEWWLEFNRAPRDSAAFAEAIDGFLRENVIDYDAHRKGDAQLTAPRLRIVSTGTFHRTMDSLGKLGGQHKVPSTWGNRMWADHLQRHDTGAHG